jgi:hypothetical protein
MANAGSLYVSILARTGGFKKGMRGVQRDLMGFKSSIGGVAAALSGAALGGSLAYFVKQNLDAMAATGRLSDRLGIATEDLIAMREAGEDAGLSFAQIQKGLQKLAVESGNSGFAGTTTEAFYKVTDAITGMTNSNMRAALAQKAFGKAGVEMLNFLDGARGKIEEARKSNDELNLSFTRMDAAKAEAANIALNNMKDVFTGIATSAAPMVSAWIIALSEKFVGLSKDGQVVFGGISQKIGGVVGATAKLMDYFDGLSSVFYVFKGMVEIGSIAIVSALWGVAKGIESIINLIPGMNADITSFFESYMYNAGVAAADSFGKVEDAMRSFKYEMNTEAAAKWIESLNKRADELASSVTKAGASIADIPSITGEAGTASKSSQPRFDLQQGDISRFALGIENKMKNKNPQIDKTNQILTQILNKTGNNAAVFA